MGAVEDKAEFSKVAEQSPRNFWAKLGLALSLIVEQDISGARRILEGLRHHPHITDEIFEIYWNKLIRAESYSKTVSRVNIPSDYLGDERGRFLLPFRNLVENRKVPKFYPWEMALPEIAGGANDSRFLEAAAANLANTFEPMIRRVHVILTLTSGVQALNEVLQDFDSLLFAGRVDISVFNCAANDELMHRTRQDGGKVETFARTLLSPEGKGVLETAYAAADLLVFLTGEVKIDSMMLQRALHLAEISDAVVQPFVEMSMDETCSTLFTIGKLRSQFADRYFFRKVNGLNFVVSTKLMRQIGLPDPRFVSSYMAGRELAYRLFAQGAYFIPLALSSLKNFDDRKDTSKDGRLFRALCPNHWDRKDDLRNEVAKVTVYIPAYNASRYIERAVESVLAQDMMDLDVCIANDGSCDNTIDLLQRLYGAEPRVRWTNNPNGGIGFASNTAIRMSRSLYIGQLDSDDCLKPGAVRRLSEYLDENPSVVCAYSSCERVDAEGNYVEDEYSWPIFSREKMMITSIAHHFRMFRRNSWCRTNGFREDIVNAVDYDIFLKLSEVGSLFHIDDKFYQRRWHGENTSKVNEGHQTRNTHIVQREALKRLGLARYWDVHVPDPKKPRNVTYRLRAGTPVVVFWPNYSGSNPYQQLLYNKMRQTAEVVSGTIASAIRLLRSGTAERDRIFFHLHWLNLIFRDVADEAQAQVAVDAFLTNIREFISGGGNLIWTIHNNVSHDNPYSSIEIRLMEELARLALIIHVHSAASLAELNDTFELPTTKVRISQHGNYIGAYPDYITRTAARTALKIDDDEDVILFTGQIRPYKGIENLIEAFRRIVKDRPRSRLILAGAPYADVFGCLERKLDPSEASRILNIQRFIENNEFQVLFHAADIAAYPYRKILTSGSLMLSLSFGVPTVVPRVGMTSDLLDGRQAGALYDVKGDVTAELEGALRALLLTKDEGKLQFFAQNARRLAEETDWPDFACQVGLFDECRESSSELQRDPAGESDRILSTAL